MIKQKTFPELRGIMAKYGLTLKDMGKVIGTTYQTFSNKLDLESEFSFSDMWKIVQYFKEKGKEKGEDITIEELFFSWYVHYSESKK